MIFICDTHHDLFCFGIKKHFGTFSIFIMFDTTKGSVILKYWPHNELLLNQGTADTLLETSFCTQCNFFSFAKSKQNGNVLRAHTKLWENVIHFHNVEH